MENKKDKRRLQYLVYLAYMMKFYSFKEGQINRTLQAKPKAGSNGDEDTTAKSPMDNLCKMMGGAPPAVVEGFLNRFTEAVEEQPGHKTYKIPSKLKDKLLAYILAMCLVMNEYHADPSHLGKDLNVGVNKTTTMFRELGCKLEAGKKVEGASASTPRSKRAVLTVPLTFPQKTR
ncbi:DNA-directed RNA polymerase I subunit RPA49 [Quaeritorhiza haematococci]|nr:DNA-directed RNA polymerase I subunit RPA49 [Quaeritorhiza haematococci]